MKFIIEADIVEEHPEGLIVLAVKNGFGEPRVQFHPDALVKVEGKP